jgi:2-polyprenyl-3-methyl-5-hydroxy-6-metoxy-1,4-benzoquinol methylase
MTMAFSVFLNADSSLTGSDELAFGLRDLRVALQMRSDLEQWLEFDTSRPHGTILDLIGSVKSEQILVILNPALVVSGNLVEALQRVLRSFPQSCIVPADPRNAVGEWQIDYASRAGFERYVARRKVLPECIPGQEQAPWMFLANREVLIAVLSESPASSWEEVVQRMPGKSYLAQHAFVHSYADYQKNDRQEILSLLPASVKKLMDVGGGEGGFLNAFQKQGDAQVLLVEPNVVSSSVARERGIAVFNGRFESLDPATAGSFDCISFLDVLEHLENPQAALEHARNLLVPNGYVVLSVPNIGHWSVVQELLQGRFDYLPVGILCCTHLRFFTEHSLRQLLVNAGFQIEAWHAQHSPMPPEFLQALGVQTGKTSAWNLDSMNTDSFHVLASKR